MSPPSIPPTQTSGDTPLNPPKCNLVDHFAIGVQLLLALIAFSSLLIKRNRERPKRPLNIWFLDTSKQAVSMSVVHMVNVFLAFVTGKKTELEDTENPCVWYFLNIFVDTTIGVGVIYVSLQFLNRVVQHLGIRDCKTGYYGNPPRPRAWFRQLLIFITSLLMMKIFVVILFNIMPFLFDFGAWLLRPFETTDDRRAEIVFVLLIFPLIMNTCQAWLIDAFIKDKTIHGGAARGEYATIGDEGELLVGGLMTRENSAESLPLSESEKGTTITPTVNTNATRRGRTLPWSSSLSSIQTSNGSDTGSVGGSPSVTSRAATPPAPES